MNFKTGNWNKEVNVRDFIQRNYTPYDGGKEFLTARRGNAISYTVRSAYFRIATGTSSAGRSPCCLFRLSYMALEAQRRYTRASLPIMPMEYSKSSSSSDSRSAGALRSGSKQT